MGLTSRTYSLLLGALVAAMLAVVPASEAAPPPAPDYQCDTSAGPSGPNPTKIMIAGDSITNASAGDYTWPYWLWRNQVDAGKNIDFVGRFQDTIDANTLTQGSRQYIDCDFDQDHEARPGVKLWTDPSHLATGTYGLGTPAPASGNPLVPSYDGYSSWIRGAVDTYKPEVVVIFAGANDLGRSGDEDIADRTENGIANFVIAKLKDVIAEARLGNPGVDVVITTAPPGNLQRFALYNNKLPGVVTSMDTPEERVVLAALPSWADHTWDGVHPDATGEVAIAAEIADQLHAVDPALAARPNPLPTPKIGPRMTAVLDPATPGNNAVTLSWTLPFGADRTIVYVRNKSGNGPWERAADLVLASLKYYYPSVGTQTCGLLNFYPQTPCTTFTVTGLSGGTEYEFMLASGKGLAVSPDLRSAPVSATPTGSVGTVDELSASASTHAVTVRWQNLGGVSGYDVQWRAGGTSTYRTTTSSGSLRTISGLVAGRAYAFRVRAQGSSSWTSEVVAVPRARYLAPGRRPVLSKVRGVRIKARWAASAGANRYQVLRRVAGGRWKVVAVTNKRVLVSGRLKKRKVYQFRVRPFDGYVGGRYSPIAKRRAR